MSCQPHRFTSGWSVGFCPPVHHTGSPQDGQLDFNILSTTQGHLRTVKLHSFSRLSLRLSITALRLQTGCAHPTSTASIRGLHPLTLVNFQGRLKTRVQLHLSLSPTSAGEQFSGTVTFSQICLCLTALGYLTKLQIILQTNPPAMLFIWYFHLFLPSVHAHSLAERFSSYPAPSVWNGLPCKVISQKHTHLFQNHLSFHLFSV